MRVAPVHGHWHERLTVAGVLTGALMPFVPTSAFALPEGGTMAAGSATISTPTATSMRIDQTTDRAILDWTRFNIAANESVHFQQPTAASIALNRVSGQEPSAIFGSLSANGQIFLLNPSGILFGAKLARGCRRADREHADHDEPGFSQRPVSLHARSLCRQCRGGEPRADHGGRRAAMWRSWARRRITKG